MLKHQSTFERLISLLLGASWAVVFIGAFYAFTSFFPIGLFYALLACFIGSIPGLLLVVILEVAQIQIDKLKEMKKQTLLLEELLKNSQTHETVSDN